MTRKCPSPALPKIPDIVNSSSLSSSFPPATSPATSDDTIASLFNEPDRNSATSHKQESCKKSLRECRQQAQHEWQDRICTIKSPIFQVGSKPKSYGGTEPTGARGAGFANKSFQLNIVQQKQRAQQRHPQRPHNRTNFRRYSQTRIHRASSLNLDDDLGFARASRKRASVGTARTGIFRKLERKAREEEEEEEEEEVKEGDENEGDNHSSSSTQSVAVSDIIGSFGLFQLLVLLFSGLREGLVGYDALIMSLILQPETNFFCADDLTANNKSHLYHHQIDPNPHAHQARQEQHKDQCFRWLENNEEPVPCNSWLFANTSGPSSGPSLVVEWSLVCQYHWLVAFIESAYFFGLVTGNLTWGYYADKLGRRPAYLAAHAISLVFGSLAVFMPNIFLFTLCRFLAAFGSIGYNIIYSIQVELIGARHRSFSTTLNHLGWGLGVVCIPLVDHLFDDYRPLIALAPLLSLVMFPWAFWLPESPRWLMANGRFEQARQELVRAAQFNGREITGEVEKDLFALEQRVRNDKLAMQKEMQQNGSSYEEKRSYRLIFTTPSLLRDTLILSYSAFIGHLYYYVQTINFAYIKNLSTEANFITSGAGEWVSVLVGAILLKFLTRKTCMSLFLLIMALSFAFQSVIDSNWLPQLDTVIVITTNNGIGTMSSLLLVFVVLIVNQEVYPTIVRQTGTSITNTVGESGSTLAPMLIQLSRMIGPANANAIYTLLCTLGIVAVQFVTRTDDIELLDN